MSTASPIWTARAHRRSGPTSPSAARPLPFRNGRTAGFWAGGGEQRRTHCRRSIGLTLTCTWVSVQGLDRRPHRLADHDTDPELRVPTVPTKAADVGEKRVTAARRIRPDEDWSAVTMLFRGSARGPGQGPRRSAAVFDPVLPGRNLPASASPVASRNTAAAGSQRVFPGRRCLRLV